VTPSGESLRERRRRETRREIRAAALRLAREHGYDKVTVEMISAAAGVSPRTFFNYFPNKDEAVLIGPPEPSAAAAAEFVAAGPAEPRQVLADLTRLLVAGLAESPPDRQALRDILELTRSNATLLAGMLTKFDAVQHALADTVASRLASPPGDELPTLLVALALTAVRTGLERWSASPPPPDADDSPVPYAERSAALLDSLFTS